MGDIWHVKEETGSGFREKEAMHCRDGNDGECWRTPSNPIDAVQATGEEARLPGWTEARMGQPLNSILRRCTFIQRQLREIIC